MATINVNITINNCVSSKQCNKCLEVKPLSEFYKRKDSKDGLCNDCKSCNKQQSKQYYENNRERICKQKNKDMKLEYNKQYYQNNKQKEAERHRKYKQNNRQKINERDIKRYHSNEQCKINTLLHSLINKALKRNRFSAKTEELLGCDLTFFRKWVHSNFTQDMNWENRGIYWELDRVIPCSAFDLTKEEEQKRCFSWQNTQPLTKIDNIKKYNTRDIESEMQHQVKINKFKELMNTSLL